MIGKRFGKLLVESTAEPRNGSKYWTCKCDCSKTTTVRTSSLNAGVTKSCGCGSVEAARQNIRDARAKRVIGGPRQLKDLFRNMHDRCSNPNNKRFANYGGRGIKVCAEWFNRRAFYNWALSSGYQSGLSLDRIDVNGDYSPTNCRFVDAFVQQNNTTRNRFLEWNGQKLTVSQWARLLNVRAKALQHRVDRNWSIARIFGQKFRGT